nr:uncharacterized protein LOC120967894 isoform X2 [Aegilops tauschii subsp. strangulata]
MSVDTFESMGRGWDGIREEESPHALGYRLVRRANERRRGGVGGRRGHRGEPLRPVTAPAPAGEIHGRGGRDRRRLLCVVSVSYSRQFLYIFACVIAGPPRRLRVLDGLRDCRGCGSGSYHISSLVEVEYSQSLKIVRVGIRS